MSKLLNSVLDRISENNNDYRKELRKLNALVDDRTSSFISEIVTNSNYTIDFSNTISIAKDKLVAPICSEVESYVIRDLRSVESVNEQFFEKINDKLESSKIDNDEDKTSFIKSLDSLLNDKYLEIVKIKRKPFATDEGINEEIERVVDDFVKEVTGGDDPSTYGISMKYKNDVYDYIKECLQKISDLYQNNFINEVSSALASAVDYNQPAKEEEVTEEKVDAPTPLEVSMPDIPNLEEVPVEQPAVLEVPKEDVPVEEETEEVIKKAEEEVVNVNKPLVLIDEDRLPKLQEFVPPVLPSKRKKEEASQDESNYDVGKILEVAKTTTTSNYSTIEPIAIADDEDEDSVDETKIVSEMINRLTTRLDAINKREAACDEEEKQTKEDEVFVNDLIESANRKKDELDAFEKELDAKEKELEEKQAELDKKINTIMPFANAVLEEEKES